MIEIIRIKGKIGLNEKTKETLKRLRLNSKYNCVVLKKPNDAQIGMVKKARDCIAFGEINQETFEKLKKTRGKQGNKFFRLHPPRGGIDSKKHFGVDKGVLGDNKDKINELIERML